MPELLPKQTVSKIKIINCSYYFNSTAGEGSGVLIPEHLHVCHIPGNTQVNEEFIAKMEEDTAYVSDREKKISTEKELVMEESTQNSSYFKSYVDLSFPEVLNLSFS